ncbi:DcaP family trimeric outer membrane transporter [Humitalea sp. 24SJ18S-53]|uniref:DcaP family trimeric outer membrane transporter n=1 Tax=Humitalea sp. 24SJ18S-53 TaxID=3422307 RepID=UPI003D668CC4
MRTKTRHIATALALLAGPALAQDPAAENRELRQRLEAMQLRMEQMEARLAAMAAGAAPAAPPRAAPAARPVAPPARPATVSSELRQARQAADEARAAAAEAQAAQRSAQAAVAPVAVRTEVENSLRGDFPGSFRIPGTDTSVRLYGFVKLDASYDFSARNQADAVTAQSIPLNPSLASLQGGSTNVSARRTRLGFETRSPTAWGQLLSQVEIDFGGTPPSPAGLATSNGFQPRLRLAYAALGDIADGQLLVGQFNSLWNDDALYFADGRWTRLGIQRLDNSTPLGTSGVRQAQVRYSKQIADGLTFAVTAETPYSDFTTSADGALYPDSSPAIAFNTLPDVLARLRYRDESKIFALRGMVRQIEATNNGPGTSGTESAVGWGVGAMTSISTIGRDFFTGHVNYGSGIGRYLDSTSNGQGGVLSQPTIGKGVLDTVDVFSVSVGYQRRWSDTVRSNFFYGYAQLDYPSFANQFSPTGAGAPLLNTRMNQAVANIIWSPIPSVDVGIEYLYTTRDILNPIIANGLTASQGSSQRLLFSTIVNF